MKISAKILSSFMLVATVCTFVTGSPIKAQEVNTNSSRANSGEAARLIVNRGANFGNDESVNLLVDGKTVAVLAYNENYDAPLSAGKHVLSIVTEPNNYSRQPQKPVMITAKAGETYTFTAVWPNSERAGLVAN
jgi:hypothetical protein